jgi:hypothetical protein
VGKRTAGSSAGPRHRDRGPAKAENIFQLRSGLGTEQKARGAYLQAQEPQGTKHQRSKHPEVVKPQRLNREPRLELTMVTWGCPQQVQSLEVA